MLVIQDTDKRGLVCQCVDAVIHPAAVLQQQSNTLCLVIIRKVNKILNMRYTT